MLFRSTFLADTYLARDEEDKFEFYARKLYQKDNTQSERYLTIAQLKLGRLAHEFDDAYKNKDWNLAFQKRDEMLGQWMLDISFNQDLTSSCSLFSELKDFEYEIIGNIYENPELIYKTPTHEH